MAQEQTHRREVPAQRSGGVWCDGKCLEGPVRQAEMAAGKTAARKSGKSAKPAAADTRFGRRHDTAPQGEAD